jgi:hypothetical protein
MTVSLPKSQTENAENKEKAKSLQHLQLLQNEWLSQGRFVLLYSLYQDHPSY